MLPRKLSPLAKKSALEVQKFLGKITQESGIDPANRSQLDAFISRIVTPQDLNKNLPELKSRLLKVYESQEKGKATENFTKFVNKAVSKNKKGKQTAKVETLLRNLKAAIAGKDVSVDEAAQFQNTQLYRVANALSDTDKRAELTSTEINEALEGLKSTVEQGREERKAYKKQREQEINQIRETLQGAIGPAEGIPKDSRPGAVRGAKNKVANLLNEQLWLIANADWANQLSSILQGTDVGQYRALQKALSINKEEISAFQDRIDYTQMEAQEVMNVLKNNFDYSDSQLKRAKRKFLSHVQKSRQDRQTLFEDKNGVVIRLNKSEMRYAYALLQNNELRAQMLGAESTMGWPKDLVVEDAEGNFVSAPTLSQHFTDMDYAIIEAQNRVFNELYSKVNAKVSEMYGIELNRVDFYRTVTRLDGEKRAKEESLMETVFRKGAANPQFTKKRSVNTLPLKIQEDTLVLSKYIYEATQFINQVDKVDMLLKVFNPDTMQLIRHRFGQDRVDIINSRLDMFTNRGTSGGNLASRLFKDYLFNVRGTTLGLSPQIMYKQFSSLWMFNRNVKLTNWLEGLEDAMIDPIGSYQWMKERSSVLRTRGKGFDVDIQVMTQNPNTKRSILGFTQNMSRFNKVLFLLIQLGDAGAITLGGKAYVYAAMKEGKSEREAIQEFEQVTLATQQSTFTSNLSLLQLSDNPLAKVLTMFQSSPMAISRTFIQDQIDLKNKRISTKEYGQRMASYAAMAVMLQFIYNAFEWEPVEQAKGIFKPLAGLAILGPTTDWMLAMFVNGIFDMMGSEDKTTVFKPNTIGPFDLVEDVYKMVGSGFRAAEEGDVLDNTIDSLTELESYAPVESAAKALSGATGVPVNKAYSFSKGIGLIVSGENFKAGIDHLQGYSSYVVQQLQKDNKSGYMY